MTTYRQKQIIHSLMLRGVVICLVCERAVDYDDIDNITVVVLNNEHARTLDNLGLRHTLCQRSKYRPIERPDLEQLVIAMNASPYKICPVCRISWVGSDFEDLILTSIQGGRDKVVLHRHCISKGTPRKET